MITRIDKCESHIERILCLDLEVALPDWLRWDTQHEVSAGGRDYRVDFYAETADAKVVIECDGQQFHDVNADALRDEAMLDAGVATDILRFRGCDLMYAREACMSHMRVFLPYLFNFNAGPLSLVALVAASGYVRGGPDKITLRCARPWEQYEEAADKRKLLLTDAYRHLRFSSDNTMALPQVRPANWDWHFRGPGEWKMSDYFLEVLSEIQQQMEQEAAR